MMPRRHGLRNGVTCVTRFAMAQSQVLVTRLVAV
jgi:hypothetical protein